MCHHVITRLDICVSNMLPCSGENKTLPVVVKDENQSDLRNPARASLVKT